MRVGVDLDRKNLSAFSNPPRRTYSEPTRSRPDIGNRPARRDAEHIHYPIDLEFLVAFGILEFLVSIPLATSFAVGQGGMQFETNVPWIAELGIRTVRYPILWERVAPERPDKLDFTWPDERLARLALFRCA